MSESRNAEIYRVCAVSTDRWDVYQGPRANPVASFHDKASALNYAMCLARGRVAWHLLLGSAHEHEQHSASEPAADETASAPASH